MLGVQVPPSVGFMIEFDFDSARLTTQGAVFLGRIIEVIKATPQLAVARILVYGHTDAVGSRGYNQGLGQARANTIVAAMIQQGIPASMIYARSFGEDHPLPGLNPVDGRNRRVEITPF
jgi:outer membrane protein OmpA-like peptidoglycan-associated protein